VLTDEEEELIIKRKPNASFNALLSETRMIRMGKILTQAASFFKETKTCQGIICSIKAIVIYPAFMVNCMHSIGF
jgi:hypothetical protein